MKVLRKVIEIDENLCTGCGRCIPACSEGAIKIVDGKARLISEKYCDGLGACLGECPEGAIRVVEKVAEEFDPEAVERHLSEGPSCSASQVIGPVESALSHWPVQIHLIPPHAPFLHGAHLLVLADCAAVAYPSLHRDLIGGRVVMMGCPKFDDVEAYRKKFSEIFRRNEIKDITVVVMEVPCCSALPSILLEAAREVGLRVPISRLTVGLSGRILGKEEVGGGGSLQDSG